jgi:hypothetical protein
VADQTVPAAACPHLSFSRALADQKFRCTRCGMSWDEARVHDASSILDHYANEIALVFGGEVIINLFHDGGWKVGTSHGDASEAKPGETSEAGSG